MIQYRPILVSTPLHFQFSMVDKMVRKFLGGCLSGKLTEDEMEKLAKSFDVVGDIAIVKISSELKKKKQIIANAIMAVNKNIKTVLNQVSPVSGDFRLRNLEWIAGEKKTITIYKEYGCSFKVDLSKVFFSPRLSFERMRIAEFVREGEIVVNMFAGVGCFSIIIAKHSRAGKIYSIDINPMAFELMRDNISLNRFEDRVEAVIGDSQEVVKKHLKGISHRVIMPLPEKAYEYLDIAHLALKSEGGFIHYYDIVYARKKENAIRKVSDKVSNRLTYLGRYFEVFSSRIVRTVGPNRYQVVLDIKVY